MYCSLSLNTLSASDVVLQVLLMVVNSIDLKIYTTIVDIFSSNVRLGASALHMRKHNCTGKFTVASTLEMVGTN